jgi:hypothetical protein
MIRYLDESNKISQQVCVETYQACGGEPDFSVKSSVVKFSNRYVSPTCVQTHDPREFFATKPTFENPATAAFAASPSLTKDSPLRPPTYSSHPSALSSHSVEFVPSHSVEFFPSTKVDSVDYPARYTQSTASVVLPAAGFMKQSQQSVYDIAQQPPQQFASDFTRASAGSPNQDYKSQLQVLLMKRWTHSWNGQMVSYTASSPSDSHPPTFIAVLSIQAPASEVDSRVKALCEQRWSGTECTTKKAAEQKVAAIVLEKFRELRL